MSQEINQDSIIGGIKRLCCDHRSLYLWASMAAILILVFGGYLVTLSAPPLMDEQYLINWINHLSPANPASEFVGWGGPDHLLDAWQPLSSVCFLLTQKVFHASIFFYRFINVVLHLLTTLLVFFVVRRLAGHTKLALSTAVLFAVFPLHAEAVSWLLGRACELAGLFFLSAFYCYLRAKTFCFTTVSPATNATSYKLLINRRWLLGGLLFFILALLCTTNAWIGLLLIIAYEFTNSLFASDNRSLESIKRSITCLAPFVIVAIVYCLLASVHDLEGAARTSSTSHRYWYQPFLNLLLPVNKTLVNNSTKDITYFLLLFLPSMLASIIAIYKDKDFRRFFFLALLGTVVLIFPFDGHAAVTTTFYGSRALYLASFPFCMFVAALLCSYSYLYTGNNLILKRAVLIVSGLWLCLTCLSYWHHLFLQTSNYKGCARDLAIIQKSLEQVVDKQHVPFVLACGLPHSISLDPAFKTDGAVCLDGQTHLLSAPQIPAGRLKDALRQGHFVSSTLTWEPDFQSLVALDLSQSKNDFGEDLAGGAMVNKLLPPLMYYRTITFDDKENCLQLESNSTRGPAMLLNAQGLSPLAGDFYYVDTRTLCPGQPEHPEMELYWTTRSCSSYDHKLRRTTAPVIVNDMLYHRYYLSMRNLGWTANGPIATVMLGFPAGAKVWLKGIGIADGGKRIPHLLISPMNLFKQVKYAYPFVNFPNQPELGLLSVDRQADNILLDYSFANVDGAAQGIAEVSQADTVFADANNSQLSDVLMRQVPLSSQAGTLALNLHEFPVNGVYRIRVIATDSSGHLLGNFSDDIACLVEKRLKH